MSLQTKTTRRRRSVPAGALRTLYEHSPIGIATLSDTGRFTAANKALQRMLGRSEQQIRASTFNDVTHADDLAHCESLFGRLLRREIDHFEIEKRFLCADGRVVWAHTVVIAVRSGSRSQGMIGMAIDVTERRKAEEDLNGLKAELEGRITERTAELAYHGALLKAQQESSPDGILVVDADGRIASHNKRFVEMWAIPPDVLASGSDDRAIASVTSLLVKPEDFIARVRHLYEHPEEKITDRLELRDGRVFERYSSPVRGEDGRYYGRVWFFRDITGRVLREKELADKTEELSRSNTELEMYAYAASHDLSAPLRRIISFGDLLQDQAKDKLDAPALEYVTRMRNSAIGALKLVTDMLMLSQTSREALAPEAVDLNAVLDEVKSELASEIDGARIEAGVLPVLLAHPILIHSLLLNLISNALKFRSPDRPPVIRVACRRDGESIELTVDDDGIGFDPVYAEKIFKPFIRLHAPSEYEGSGIGLATCRRVALRYGGSITADSAPGRGATFTLRLPAAMCVR